MYCFVSFVAMRISSLSIHTRRATHSIHNNAHNSQNFHMCMIEDITRTQTLSVRACVCVCVCMIHEFVRSRGPSCMRLYECVQTIQARTHTHTRVTLYIRWLATRDAFIHFYSAFSLSLSLCRSLLFSSYSLFCFCLCLCQYKWTHFMLYVCVLCLSMLACMYVCMKCNI